MLQQIIKNKSNNQSGSKEREKENGAQDSPEPDVSEPQSAWLNNLTILVGDQTKDEQMSINDQQSFAQLMMMKIDDFGNSTGRVAGVTHGANSSMTATKYNYEQDHFFEGTNQDGNLLEYIKLGGLQEDASIFWDRINIGFFDNVIDPKQIRMLRGFYKLNLEQGQKLTEYQKKKQA